MDKIIRFTSSSCMPCKMLANNLQMVDTTVPIEVVDTDVLPEVASDYGVRSVPVMIYTRDNVEIGRLIGVKPALFIEEWIDKFKPL